MKIITLLALFLVLSIDCALSDPPKSGQALGTITTTDGKTYADAKLAVIEPDGISILYADGGAKLAFTSLSPEMQKQFGYDPEKSAFYAREQQYLAQIDKLQQENAALRKRLDLASDQPPAAASAPNQQQPTVAGFHAFFYELKSQSVLRNGRSDQGYPKYSGGALAGMKPVEAEVYAQQKWETLSHAQQLAYEQKARAYGDPIAKQDELDRISAAHPHPSGATVQGSDGTSYNVQYH